MNLRQQTETCLKTGERARPRRQELAYLSSYILCQEHMRKALGQRSIGLQWRATKPLMPLPDIRKQIIVRGPSLKSGRYTPFSKTWKGKSYWVARWVLKRHFKRPESRAMVFQNKIRGTSQEQQTSGSPSFSILDGGDKQGSVYSVIQCKCREPPSSQLSFHFVKGNFYLIWLPK